MGATYALVAVACNVMFSASRVCRFTSGVPGMLGGVLGALFIRRLGLPVLPGLLATLAVCALLGVVTEIVAVRSALGGRQGRMLPSERINNSAAGYDKGGKAEHLAVKQRSRLLADGR